MTVYLVRHGRDDDTVRGGWSDASLSAVGISQAEALAARLKSDEAFHAGVIYTSDLPRAKETAQILGEALSLPVIDRPAFRETNNGVLAGMKNEIADEKYPNLYWNSLGWNQTYPEGESPHSFYKRIMGAWKAFRREVENKSHDVILVTHGGVINVILHIERGMWYSNKRRGFYTPNAGIVAVPLRDQKEEKHEKTSDLSK